MNRSRSRRESRADGETGPAEERTELTGRSARVVDGDHERGREERTADRDLGPDEEPPRHEGGPEPAVERDPRLPRALVPACEAQPFSEHAPCPEADAADELDDAIGHAICARCEPRAEHGRADASVGDRGVDGCG